MGVNTDKENKIFMFGKTSSPIGQQLRANTIGQQQRGKPPDEILGTQEQQSVDLQLTIEVLVCDIERNTNKYVMVSDPQVVEKSIIVDDTDGVEHMSSMVTNDVGGASSNRDHATENVRFKRIDVDMNSDVIIYSNGRMVVDPPPTPVVSWKDKVVRNSSSDPERDEDIEFLDRQGKKHELGPVNSAGNEADHGSILVDNTGASLGELSQPNLKGNGAASGPFWVEMNDYLGRDSSSTLTVQCNRS
ncbi:hypothetical protein GOBAR_DD00855 [Gossypium barbadense]|nr:hypothetical protein GOBAR_DD00855 [Gossypium barbadense]